MEDKPKGDAYTMAFIERKGGSEEVARKTGINRQTVRQVANGRNAPSYEFIIKMMEAYPSYDLKVGVNKRPVVSVTAGEETSTTFLESPNASSSSLVVLATENAGLRNQVVDLKNTVRILESIISSQLGTDFDRIKTESSNESTQDGQLRLDLVFDRLKEKRFIPISIRDAFGISRQWPRGLNS